MFKLLFGGTPGLANRSALGEVKLLIGLSGLDFRLLSAMMYCVEFCGAFGTAVFFAGAFFFAGGGAGFLLSLLFLVAFDFAPLPPPFFCEKVVAPPPGLNNSAVTLVFGSKKAATAGSSGCPRREVLAGGLLDFAGISLKRFFFLSPLGVAFFF
jgi:hypothetical protein